MSDDPKAPAQDFPIAWADDQWVTRRQFATALAGLSAACFTCTAAVALRPSPAVVETAPAAIPGAEDLVVGDALAFEYGGRSCLAVRLPVGLVAFDQSCTHLGCPVTFEAAKGQLHCPCHEAYFNAETGAVLAGPATRPMPRLTIEARDGRFWAVGWEQT